MPSPIRHRIIRTRNRHSRAVLHGDTILIRLARNLSPLEEREHIDHLLKKMERVVERESKRKIINPFLSLLQGANRSIVTLASGKSYVFSLIPSKRTRARRTPEGWEIGVAPALDRHGLHRFLWKLLSQAEQDNIRMILEEVNKATFDEPLRSFRLSYASTQWGSCTPSGRIMINTSLLFLPTSLLRYVIIHELAHRLVANHSSKYWALVGRFFPPYQEARRHLHTFRICSL